MSFGGRELAQNAEGPGFDSPELPSKKKKKAQGKTFYIAFSLRK